MNVLNKDHYLHTLCNAHLKKMLKKEKDFETELLSY